LAAHFLYSLHDAGLLSQKRVTKIRRPPDVFAQPLENIREKHQRLNAGIPILLLRSIFQCDTGKPRILSKPLRGLNNLERIS